jgi:quinol monooxygenase YgiN
LHPGRRDELIALFDREFVETQEAVGMTVLGQFRDLDDPDRFVWLRSFADMAARKEALTRFYGGPVWRAHRERANATMIDSDDVLLLRPVGGSMPVPERDGRTPGLIVASTKPAAGVESAADEVGEVAPGESRKLFVGGIPSSAQDVELRGHFARFGAVRSMVLMRDKETGHSRGFGFVEFDDEEAADKALGDGENPKHFICGRLVSSPPFALTSD